ncbi:MAG TPA: GGDEF domain-containing protein [Burkholderiaceae bacterium]|jgi:diguanylate cyclase (GGDEF)-like protein
MISDAIARVLDAEDVLKPAHAVLGVADPDEARAAALAAVTEAEGREDRHRLAKALLLLAHVDRLASRFRQSHDIAVRASQLFRALGDTVGESGARSTLAHCSTCLGRNEEAVESALISVHLAQPDASAAHKAMLFNYLGVAYLWSRDFQKAGTALKLSIQIAEQSGGAVSAFQPLINQIFCEALAALAHRYHHGILPPLHRMVAARDRCEALVRQGQAAGLFHGGDTIGAATWLFTAALVRAWTGEPAAAAALIAQADALLAPHATPTMAHAFGRWVGAELAWARGDPREAIACCTLLVEMARQLEYEQLVCVGHQVLSELHEALHEPVEALAALRALRDREAMIRTESLQSRERAVQWHLDLRLVEQNVRELQGVSRHLERLSHEDSLTGLANRRCLEEKLRTVLDARQAGGAPLSVAFIDVDRFKLVNDRHSHHAGDLVLKAIAGLMLQAVRAQDVAARLAGDEFAILFQRADEAESASVCARISTAVRDHPWDEIAPGLAVTVSIGTAAARPGDSVESLLHRGDAAMYEAKRRLG